MNKIKLVAIFSVVLLVGIVALDYKNTSIEQVNDQLASNPPAAGGEVPFGDISTGSSDSNTVAGFKSTTSTRSVFKVKEGNVTSYSDVPSRNQGSTTGTAEIIQVKTSVPSTGDSNVIQVGQSQWASQFDLFPQDQDGWSIIEPAADSRLIYVSNSTGNDSNAKFYSSKEITNPHNPPSNVLAYKTVSAALKQQRADHADWVLLKKGEEWDSGAWYLNSGRSSKEPLVITSYGGDYEKRPLVKTGTNSAVILKSGKSFIAITGIEFYANKRDPNGVNFIGWDNVQSPGGFVSVVGSNQPSQAITLEDNVFNFYGGAVVFSGSDSQKNIVVRRNQLLNSYSTSSHSQGIFTSKTTMLLEENLIDHNGWYQQNYETLNSREKGQATWFNHNIYISSPLDTVITGNLITRSSSIGIKVAGSANTETKQNGVVAENLIVSNNLFAEGEIGISAGGNKDFDNGYRFKNFTFKSNVMIHLGDSQPLRRTFAMGIQTVDWDGGVITGNQFLYTDNEDVTNIHGVDISGLTRNVTVSNNTFKNLRDSTPVSPYNDEPVENLIIENNVAVKVNLSSRHDLTSYFNTGGAGNAVSALVEKSKTQSKFSWNKAYTASEINEYLMN